MALEQVVGGCLAWGGIAYDQRHDVVVPESTGRPATVRAASVRATCRALPRRGRSCVLPDGEIADRQHVAVHQLRACRVGGAEQRSGNVDHSRSFQAWGWQAKRFAGRLKSISRALRRAGLPVAAYGRPRHRAVASGAQEASGEACGTGGMVDEARAKRLKAALRDNLHRRKSQARGRAQDPAPDSVPGPDTAPGTKPADTDDTGTDRDR